jgi:hypothetical protein
LDKNNDNSDKTFYSIDGGINWIGSAIEGSVMIRPIFSTALDAELTTEEIAEEQFTVYPNPFSSTVTFDVKDFKGVSIFSATGQFIQFSSENVVDMTEQPAGFYFAQLNGKTIKLIKN